MKHRGSSKIKYEHTMIEGLRELLEKLEPTKEIKAIIPGRISRKRSHSKLTIRVQRPTITGIKCLATVDHSVQEVFIVTNEADTVMKIVSSLSE